MVNEVKFWCSTDPGGCAETLSFAHGGFVVISDSNENVILESEEHARALIKSPDSAIADLSRFELTAFR